MSKLIENRSSKKNIFAVRSYHQQMIENISKKSTRSARSHLHLKVIRDSKEIIKNTYSTVQHSTERYPADHKDATFQNSSCSTTVEPKRRDFSQQLISCSSCSGLGHTDNLCPAERPTSRPLAATCTQCTHTYTYKQQDGVEVVKPYCYTFSYLFSSVFKFRFSATVLGKFLSKL